MHFPVIPSVAAGPQLRQGELASREATLLEHEGIDHAALNVTFLPLDEYSCCSSEVRDDASMSQPPHFVLSQRETSFRMADVRRQAEHPT